ncbi:substrate-binding domain-containing protein [Stappia sp. F7233]|uniref:Substrate-binding domain-containing protein n=1 Tax=Stappia albiluteola TaxID=2758565 RepID=A0A839AAH6_9HYPH|nr:substrate-binding domain-containing protein [Stappia albiluteola]MBA5776034.1 substrate-binding domain-containing protein [Stappia albiluteola]
MNLKELAAHLGLSQTTVSRALNGYPEVSEATRTRVREAAERLEYRPNAAARRLATGRTGTVAIIFPSERSLLLDPHFLDFLAGVAEKLADDDVELTLRATRRNDELETYRRLVRNRRVDGFIVSSPLIEDERVRLLSDLDVPFVLHGRTDTQAPYAYLDIDNEGAFRRATELLVDLGHRRIGLLNGKRELNFARDREAGYLAALAAHGIAPDPGLIVNAAMTEEIGYRNASALLARPQRPTALLAASVLLAFGAYRAARDLGLVIGKDVSVIAHDDGLPFLKAETLDPPLATTVSPIRAGGYRLAELLLARINGNPPEDLREVAPVDLVFRASIGRMLT